MKKQELAHRITAWLTLGIFTVQPAFVFAEGIVADPAASSVQRPVVTEAGHKVYGKRITKISADQPIVIEGIHALNEAMTPGFSRDEKFKIYISPLTQITIDDHNRIPAPTSANRPCLMP